MSIQVKFFLMLSILTFAACQPSDLVKDREGVEQGDGVEAVTFASGEWSDGLGNRWDMKIINAELTGIASDGSIRGVTMTGSIYGNNLTYQIYDTAGVELAHGTARLVDTRHAVFETMWVDGQPVAHGLFHFGHAASESDPSHADARNGPVDLRPVPELRGG